MQQPTHRTFLKQINWRGRLTCTKTSLLSTKGVPYFSFSAFVTIIPPSSPVLHSQDRIHMLHILISQAPAPKCLTVTNAHTQSKNPISSSKIPLSPTVLACLCTPLFAGGHSFCRCLSCSASSNALAKFSNLPCTTYSCSASASASSTWWLSRSVALGMTIMGICWRSASRIEPEPGTTASVQEPDIHRVIQTYQHDLSPRPPVPPSHSPSPISYTFPTQPSPARTH